MSVVLCADSLPSSYEVMGVPIPKKPAKKVLVVLRGDPPARRAIVNHKEMLAVMDNYGIEYTCVPVRGWGWSGVSFSLSAAGAGGLSSSSGSAIDRRRVRRRGRGDFGGCGSSSPSAAPGSALADEDV
ncbi:MAG: hypothetical protein ACOVQL_09355, partial [Limnohabitans sp.]